jgi:hypothetical protein
MKSQPSGYIVKEEYTMTPNIEAIAAEIIANKCSRPGCDKPRHGRSKYCSRACARWNYNQNRQRYTADMMHEVHGKQTGATVHDPLVALPYHISVAEAKKWLQAGQFEKGVTVVFPDRRVTVGALLEQEIV